MSQGTSTTTVARVEANVEMADPDFIVYLLDPEQEYNCYFVVGNPDLGSTERIGVVKKMLLAHSVVLRAELQDSKIAEKNDVKVTDVFPHTFKNLLRYVYGHDNIAGLNFDEADNLLYAAEKYMMSKLKNRLATQLMTMLDCSNICSLMNNPACYTVLELNSAITEILQLETDQVLASPQFLDLSPKAFLTILEQEMLNVPEIELWRSAIEWAKNRVTGGSENAVALRNELNEHLQHIRVCSMTNDDILLEILPTEVLTSSELKSVSKSRKTGKVQPDLTTICNVIEDREHPLVESELLIQLLRGNHGNYGNIAESSFTLKTKDTAVGLCSVQPYQRNSLSHQCNCTISIQRDTEPPVVVRFEEQVNTNTNWNIPIVVNGKNVWLKPNSTYTVKFTFSCTSDHWALYRSGSPYSVSGNHFSIKFHGNSRGGSENAVALRNELNEHLRHIRVCTMTNDDLFLEVMPTEVITASELLLVSKSRKTGEVQPDLTTICNKIEEREQPLVKSEVLKQSLRGNCIENGVRTTVSTLKLKTKDRAIELCSVQLCSNSLSSHQCSCTISIQKDKEPPVVARFEGQVNTDSGWTIPVVVDKKNVQLSPDSTYTIKFTFSCSNNHLGRFRGQVPYQIDGSHFTVEIQVNANYAIFQVDQINYKTLTKKIRH